MNCSTLQALDVWADLHEALEGRHPFGSDTAEVYGYRLRPESPGRGSVMLSEDTARADRRAADDLREIAALFEERHGCRVLVVLGRNDEGIPVAEWREPLAHRVHVRVVGGVGR